MDEVTRLGPGAQGSRSKRTQSASGREKSRNSKPLPSTPTSPRSTSSRSSLAGTRTNSAPLVPLLEAKPLPIGKDADTHTHRDSITSIKDDPFFRHYQSPTSVSLARELRSAIYEEREGDGEASRLSPTRNKSSSDNPGKLPVSHQIRRASRVDTDNLLATVEERYGGYQYCCDRERGSRKEHTYKTGTWAAFITNGNRVQLADVCRQCCVHCQLDRARSRII